MNGCLTRGDDWACLGLTSAAAGRHPFGEEHTWIGRPGPYLHSGRAVDTGVGVVAVAELANRLGMIAALDDAVGGIKQRNRGLPAGGLLLALAQTQMLGCTSPSRG
jgi:hypothetical protein